MNITEYITSTSRVEWTPLKEEGINTQGIYVKSLRFDEQQQRPPSILLKFDAGASYPFHNHPGGEEIFVIKGDCMVNDTDLQQGDYLYTPPGFKHAVHSKTGCELLLIIPEEVVIEDEQVICSTCGTYYPAYTAPNPCTICMDERQYLPPGGQAWTSPSALHANHGIKFHKLHERLYELEINPAFAIGQRALLVLSDKGNVLWDCIPLLDEPTISFIRSKGGLKAIAFSHPHYYSNMNGWAATFDCPVYIHANDEPHIMVKGEYIRLWDGDELALWDGMKLYLIGGHFEGSSILQVPFLSPGGSILCGDTLFLSPSKRHFSVLRSYPNRIPLPRHEMGRIKNRFDSIPFDSFYGYIKSQNLYENVKEVFTASMEKYLI